MKRIAVMILLVSLLLSGCAGWLDGHYSHVVPHEEQSGQENEQVLSVSNYFELCTALAEMARNGTQSGVISVADYDQEKIEPDMANAVQQTLTQDPIAAYAVEKIEFEVGTNSGQPAIAVSVSYVHDRAEIRKIKQVQDLEAAREAVADALDQCDSGIVLYLKEYEQTDFAQLVQDYADTYPQNVMETPAVTVNVYPEEGMERVVELKFVYQSSRDALRNMQTQVETLFDAAVDYVSVTAQHRGKFSQMYSLLMERFQNYQQETSITPAYSLLLHGVGDAKAFAVVYAAMCREAGLECHVVTGTRAGEPWFWNLVKIDDVYYHVDLLECKALGYLQEKTDAEMSGYVWDYSAYPTQDPQSMP